MTARKSRRKRIWRRVRRTGYVAAALMILGPLAFATYGYFNWPVPDPVDLAKKTDQVITIKYNDGNDLANIVPGNGQRRTMIQGLDEVSEPMQQATIAAEDASFYSNPGFSVKGILAAVKNQFTGGIGGGSTLTQQYIKLELEKDAPTLTRKFQEVVVAFKMTNEQEKDEILTAYLNTAYYGRGAYGVHAAAEAYFNKTPDKLNPSEAAVLAGVVQSPTANDPAYDPEKGGDRWTYVAGQMMENGFVTPQEHEQMELPKTRGRDEWTSNKAAGPQYHIQKRVEEELAEKGYDLQELSYGGFTIKTTIDQKAQRAAEKAVQDVTGGQQELRTSLVALNPSNGHVKAYYGGSAEGEGFDYANAPQPPGSAFKPFVALAGLEQGSGLGEEYDGRTPQEIMGTTFENAEGIACDTPTKCGVREAMTKSVNTPFVNMIEKFGASNVRDAAHEAGIPKQINGEPTLQNDDGTVDAGIALGAYPVRPIDMASAYGTFANNGERVKPQFVTEITNSERTHTFENPNAAEPAFAMDESGEAGEPTEAESKNIALHVVESMLKVAEESEIPLSGDREVASKTGTHQFEDTGQNRNAWMVGATPQISTAVGMLAENEEGTTIPLVDSAGQPVYGSGLPGEVWKNFMDQFHQGLPNKTFDEIDADDQIGQWSTPPPEPSTTSRPSESKSSESRTSETESSETESSETESSETSTSDTCDDIFDCDPDVSPPDEPDENGVEPTRPRGIS